MVTNSFDLLHSPPALKSIFNFHSLSSVKQFSEAYGTQFIRGRKTYIYENLIAIHYPAENVEKWV